MKNFLKISTAAAVMLSASVALAQNGSDVTGGTVGATVGGIFVPAPATGVGGSVVVTVPASTPVTVSPVQGVTPRFVAAAATVNSVSAGSPQAVAALTQSLSTAVPAAAAQSIATALQQLGASPSVGSVITAITTWNATIASLTPAQVLALVSSPQGIMAARAIQNAYFAARFAR